MEWDPKSTTLDHLVASYDLQGSYAEPIYTSSDRKMGYKNGKLGILLSNIVGQYTINGFGVFSLLLSIHRLRIGHTCLIYGHLMGCEAPHVCGRCQVRLSVFHVLVECTAFSVPRNRFFPSLMSVPPYECLSLLSEYPTFSSSTFFAFFKAILSK